MHRVKPTVRQVLRRKAKRGEKQQAMLAAIRECEPEVEVAETEPLEDVLILDDVEMNECDQRMIA